jgi:hypothetical protein
MKRVLHIFAICMFVSATVAVAQQELANPLMPAKARPRIFIGPVGGYNSSLHSSGFQSVAGDVLCPDFEQGSANGYYFGFSGEYLLGKPQDSKSSIIARIVYNYMPAFYQVAGDRLPSINPATNGVVESEVQHVASIEYGLVDFEVVYKLNLFNSNFGIVVGPSVGMPIKATIEQRMELIEPLNAVFDPTLAPNAVYTNNGRTIITKENGDIEDKAALRVAIKAGVQYEIPIGRLLLVPCMYYNFGVTEVSPANNLRVNALQIGADLRFAI